MKSLRTWKVDANTCIKVFKLDEDYHVIYTEKGKIVLDFVRKSLEEALWLADFRAEMECEEMFC